MFVIWKIDYFQWWVFYKSDLGISSERKNEGITRIFNLSCLVLCEKNRISVFIYSSYSLPLHLYLSTCIVLYTLDSRDKNNPN